MQAWAFWVYVAERRPLSYLCWGGFENQHLYRRTSGYGKEKRAPKSRREALREAILAARRAT